MKIALVCPYNMFEHEGGVKQLVVHLADGLRAKGHVVKIITPRPAGYHGKIPKDYILLGSTRSFKGGFGSVGNWGSTLNVNEVQRVLSEEKFDVINLHEPWIPMIGWQIVNFSDAAHVGSFHANLIDNAAGKFWFNTFYPVGKPLVEKMHILTAPSAIPAATIIKKANLSNPVHKLLVDNFKFIPNGIDLNKYGPLKTRKPLSGEGTKTIVYVGRLEKRKGVEYLLEAFATLVDKMPKTHLIIAGKGAKRKELEKYIKTNKIPNVKFAGYVSDDEKRSLFGNTDLVCAPAMYGESFGIVLVEAMAMGAPVIAGANLGYKSVMTGDGRLGLIDPESIDDFATRMEVFLTMPQIEKIMRDWGVRESQKYKYENVIRQYEDTFKEAIRISNRRKLEAAKKKNDRRFKKIFSRSYIRRHA